MNMKFRSVIISDIHFGVMDAEELLKELDDKFISYLKSLDKLDLICITGDFFDHILYLNEIHANRAYYFMDELMVEADRLNCQVRIVYGTESHECNQYSIFFSKLMNNRNFKVIKTVSEEELDKGIKVLYIPEEYVYNKKDVYGKFFDKEKEYDYVFGHGVITELMPTDKHVLKDTKDTKRAKVPVFNTNELTYCCKGEIFFGHYHVHCELGSNVSYVGSFSRWCFGEEEKKGFIYSECDIDKERYSHTFIENNEAPDYVTINYGYDNPIFSDRATMDSELARIENITNNDLVDHVRLVMNVPDDYEGASALINNLSERFKDSKKIKMNVTNGFVNKNRKINEEYLKESIKKYGFIRDKSMPKEEISHQFILTKFDKDIPAARIKEHLDTKDILSLI